MAFEVFEKGSAPIATVPAVTVQKRGLISINRAAFDSLGAPEAVLLLWDAERRLIGIQAADVSAPNAYPARPQSKESVRGPVLVAGNLFTRYIDLDTTVAQRWRPRLEGNMLVIDLNEPGERVISNRNRAKEAAES